MILRILKQGASRSLHPRLLFSLWLVNFSLALLIAPTVLTLTGRTLSHSGFRDEMERGFSVEWWIDVRSHFGSTLDAIALQVVFLLVAAALVQVFLHGAILGQLGVMTDSVPVFGAARPQPFLSQFFNDGARLFGRFLRLSLWGGFFYAIVFLATKSALAASVARLLETSDRTLAVARLVRDTFVLAAVAVVVLTLDYARIHAARQRSRAMTVKFFEATVFLFRHWRHTLLLALVVAVLTILVLAAISYWLRDFAQRASPWAAVLYFQTFMLIRVFSRLWLIASEYALHRELVPATPAQEPWLIPFWSAARPNRPWNS